MRVFELWCKVTEAESENENREQEMNMTDLHDDTPSKPPSGDRYKMLITQMKTKSWKQGKKLFILTNLPVFLQENKDEWANIPPQWRETLTRFVNAGLRLVVEGGTIWKV